METPLKNLQRLKADQVIASLRERNMAGQFVKDKEEAIQAVLNLIPGDALVGFGGSQTIQDAGILEALRAGTYKIIDRFQPGLSAEELEAMRQKALTCDVFLASVNAITITGKIVCVDGTGNRVAPIVYGPRKVILVAGINKIVTELPEAFERLQSVAAPANCIRLGAKTPCAQDGICDEEECRPPARICNCYIIVQGQARQGRLHVVLVGQAYGF